MKIGALISIREKSKRFPGKVLKEMYGQSVAEHLIDRLKMCTNVDMVIIATSDDPRDEIFVDMSRKKMIGVFRGSRDDKLKRYLQTANHFSLDAVIIVDGDDILCFPEIIDRTADILRKNQNDAVFWRELPLGASPSGLTKHALERVMEIKDEDDTEVWGGYFLEGNYFNVAKVEPDKEILKHPEIRMTLDYIEDFNFLKAIFDELYTVNPRFNSFELMDLLVNKKPELNEINRKAQKKYEQHLKKSAPVRFKKG